MLNVQNGKCWQIFVENPFWLSFNNIYNENWNTLLINIDDKRKKFWSSKKSQHFELSNLDVIVLDIFL